MNHQPPDPESHAERAGESGRSQPRPVPLPEGFEHRLTFWAMSIWDENRTVIVAECLPCDGWRRRLDGGHSLADLINLYVQHAGLDAAKELVIATLAKHAVDLPADLLSFSPYQCQVCGATDTCADLDPVFDSHTQGGTKFVCHDLTACYQRAAARAVHA